MSKKTKYATSNAIQLPSQKQPGDHCIVEFGQGMVADNCHVMKVHFTASKVQYDIEAIIFPVGTGESGFQRIRLYNVDSDYVK